MKWLIGTTLKSTNPQKLPGEVVRLLLKNRGLETPAAIESFLHSPDPQTLVASDVGLKDQALDSVVIRLRQAIHNHQPILIYGDYDADGITATAILWATLHKLQAEVYPFIPSRELHGYGLSVTGLDAALVQYHLTTESPSVSQKPLVITVDNGITAEAAAHFLADKNIELIITDHHQIGLDVPPCVFLLHTDTLSGAGIAWMLSKALLPNDSASLLDLVTIGTVADLMPLIGPNRSLVKFGLEALKKTTRPGLLALFGEAGIDPMTLTTYHVGFLIAPRLNAMGRLKNALDSLRLLLTSSSDRAARLAHLLGSTNRDRQDLTSELLDKARSLVGETSESIIIIDHEDFHEGVIGLVAGKLTETYYRPSIVISRHETVSKASARSIHGVNIIELIRTHQDLLLNAGGHPMAAGLTLETKNIESFRLALQNEAKAAIAPDLLTQSLSIDCELTLPQLSQALFTELETLKPFGIGNPKPVFAVHGVKPVEIRTVGSQNQHLKLVVEDSSGSTFAAIGFGLGERAKELIGKADLSLAFTLEENVWNGRHSLQLQVKDINAF